MGDFHTIRLSHYNSPTNAKRVLSLLHVALSSWKVNIAENPIAAVGLYIRSSIVYVNTEYVPTNYFTLNFLFLPDWELALGFLVGLKETTEKLREHSIREVFSSIVLKCSSLAGHGKWELKWNIFVGGSVSNFSQELVYPFDCLLQYDHCLSWYAFRWLVV